MKISNQLSEHQGAPDRVGSDGSGSARVCDLKRRLKNARSRALFWSGNASFTGRRFNVRKNRNGWEGYELAMCDVRNLCDAIERETGKRPKQTDPKRAVSERYHKLMSRVALSSQNIRNLPADEKRHD